MEAKLGSIEYGDYCVEYYVHFKGRKILVRSTDDVSFEFPVEEFADGEDELLDEFVAWLEDNIAVRFSVIDKNGELNKDEELAQLRARVKRLEEECNWLESHTRKVQ